jgi:putative heme-binding domain-containing protein
MLYFKNLIRTITLGFSVFQAGGIGATAADATSEDSPHWIWSSEEETDEQVVSLGKRISCDRAVVAATLRCSGLSAGASIHIDGRKIASVEPYDPLLTIDVTEFLTVGPHRLEIVAASVKGPSAVFLKLDVEFSGGELRSIVSDRSWSVTSDSDTPGVVSHGPVSHGPVDSRLILSESRRVGISAVDNYEQWKQALGAEAGTHPASFVITPGFEIQLVRSAGPGEGSWVSLLTDTQGRLLIAKEDRGLLRMTLSADGSQVIDAQLINDTLEECRGLVLVGSDLYANANNSKGLYRLRSIGGDRFSDPELVLSTTGGVGHGRNDLALGPDGKIYSIHGDSVDLPTGITDHTSPFREARRGVKTSEGHLLRVDPESGEVEVLAAGLRNPFGIDFNLIGDIFTYDADAEYDMGAPWYRPTRVSDLLVGGDYGWRGVTKSWPPYYPDHADNTRPNLDIGKGSPTAVKFGTRSHFPPRYRQALFILDWAYGRVIAVHCIPRGSSYLMTAETFLKGRPLNVTDLDFGSDGSMYLITGGRKTRSALYRIRYIGDRAAQVTEPTELQRARDKFADHARSTRRDLESLLQTQSHTAAVKRIWSHLSDPDPWISQAAINLLERSPLSQWKNLALKEQNKPAALRSLLALARASQPEFYPLIIDRLNEISLAGSNRSQQLTALQAYSLCLTDEIANTEHDAIALMRDRLGEMYPDASYRVNRLLSDLLVRAQSPDVIPKTVRLLKSTSDQTEHMHYLHVLRGVREGWTLKDRQSYFAGLRQAQDFVAGAGMNDFLGKIREESMATLTDGERKALAPLLDPRPAAAVVVDHAPRPIVQKWTVKELMDSTVSSDGDVTRGEAMFSVARCNQCHRVSGNGTLLGPDLTSVSRRFSRQDLLTAIIEPSKVIAENYRSIQIVTVDGKVHVGQVMLGGDYRSPLLRLATDPTSPQTTIQIDKTSIEAQRTSPLSWMPEGLLETLTRQEVLDLLAYIESAGGLSL